MNLFNRLILLCCTISFLQQELRAEQPNVILIYADDQGTLDLNCYGSKDLWTPWLDGMAAEGVRFTQMYSPSAICSASRAGLMTGRIPVRAGVPGNVSSKKGVAGMPAEEVTIAEMLKAKGYQTGHVGKWHLGYTPPTMPNGQGFDYSFGHMGGCIDNYSHFFYWNGPNRHDLWRNGNEIWQDGKFFPDAMVEEVNAFITRNKSRPFFLYWAINVPHYPLQGTKVWREHYKKLKSPRREYAAFVSTMDDCIGRVFGTLVDLNLKENTIVIFQSDHGHSTEERTFFGGGNAGRYRGAKGCLFEGGIRVPSIVRWPKRVPKGGVRNQLAVGCDWLPTIAEWTKAELPKRKLDGKSLAEVIGDPAAESPHDQFAWQLGQGPRAQWAVRDGAWKLLGNARDRSNKGTLSKADQELFLVNLKQDDTEMKNLAKEYPEVVDRLKKLHGKLVK